jgi:two-component system, cell cycle sensor histidine kinase and response regulator CckA
MSVETRREEEVGVAARALGLPEGTETVLLVGDDPGVRVLARLVLQGCGYEVLVADDSTEAVHIAGRHPRPIHLLVSDLRTSPGEGDRVAEAVRSLYPEMRVLFLSGGDAVKAGRSHLQTPFSPTMLARKVREALDTAR